MTGWAWVFFGLCWAAGMYGFMLTVCAVKLAASLKQARALLLTVAEHQTEETRQLIYDFLEETRR